MKRLLTLSLAFLLVLSISTDTEAVEFDIGTGIVMQSGEKPGLGIMSELSIDLMENGKGWTFQLEPGYLYVNGEDDTELQVHRMFMMLEKQFTLDSTSFWYHFKLAGGAGGWSIVKDGNDIQHRGFQLRLSAHAFVADIRIGFDVINISDGPDIFMPFVGLKMIGL